MKRFQSCLLRLVLPCFRPKEPTTTSPSEMETEQALIHRESSKSHEGDQKAGSICEKLPYSHDGNAEPSEPSSGCCDDVDLVNGRKIQIGDDSLIVDDDLVGDGDQPIDGTHKAEGGKMENRLAGCDDGPIRHMSDSDGKADADTPVHGDLTDLEVDENFEGFSSASVNGEVYRFFHSSMFQITDAEHKCLLLHEFSGQAQLVASHLQGDNADNQVILNMASYTSRNFTEKRPVTLGIADRNLYLSCVMNDSDPQLTLESVDGNLPSIRPDLLRFLFLKDGQSNCTFESAACPTWFLCTDQADRTLVTVSSSENQTTIQNFNVFSATR